MKNIYFRGIYVLKASNINFFLICILRSDLKKYILYKNKSKRGNFRYTPPLLLVNSANYELIDCTNDYKNEVNIHMSDHFINLYNCDDKSYSKYYLPEVSGLSELSNGKNAISGSRRFIIFILMKNGIKLKFEVNYKKILKYLETKSNIKILITSGLDRYSHIDKIKLEFYKKINFLFQ